MAPPSPNGTPKPGTVVLTPTQRLKRFVSDDVAKKLMDLVHNLAGKTSAALREDAFLVTINGVGALAGQGHNVSLDNLVKRRQEEAVRVFAYFLELILENEQRLVIRQAGAASAPDASAGETNKSPAAPEPKVKKGGLKPDAFGSVADIAAMAAEQKEDALMPPPPPTDEQRLGFEALLGSGRFVRSVLACSMEVVVASYKTATLKFPAIPRLLGLDAFDVSSIIEPFVRADTTMPREVKKHFNALEETIMETLAWSKGSSLFGFMRAAESGYLPPRPAAAALAAVSGAADSPGATAPVSPGGDTKVIKRERSFSVAAVGAEAASHDEKSPEASPSNSSGGAGGDKGDHIAAFSTPLKGATTPARPGQAKPRLSMGGVRRRAVAQAIRSTGFKHPSGSREDGFKLNRGWSPRGPRGGQLPACVLRQGHAAEREASGGPVRASLVAPRVDAAVVRFDGARPLRAHDFAV